ncbi:MAG: hypothetical protein JHC93_02015 [Parachlamydiales bacterium]|nr:hypothetical protein [Parachlamydiales bacterium]
MVSMILVGFKGCGKSTVGRALANLLGWEFYDTDKRVEKQFHELDGSSLSCREICALHGEDKFRFFEQVAVQSILPQSPAIIATGGGTIISQSCIDHLKKLGKMVYLDCGWQALEHRFESGPTPSFVPKKSPMPALKELYVRRKPIYHDIADYEVSVEGKTVDNIVNEIMENIKQARV